MSKLIIKSSFIFFFSFFFYFTSFALSSADYESFTCLKVYNADVAYFNEQEFLGPFRFEDDRPYWLSDASYLIYYYEPDVYYVNGELGENWVGSDLIGSYDPIDSGTGISLDSVCVTVVPATYDLLGSIAFGLGILIVLLFVIVLGFIYNNIERKKPWLH